MLLGISFMLTLLFFAAGLYTLEGGIGFYSDFGSFLNTVLDRVTVESLQIHDHFETGGGSAVFLLCAVCFFGLVFAMVYMTLRYRVWLIMWALLFFMAGLQMLLPGCPWYISSPFYLFWAAAALWITVGQKRAAVRLGACFLCGMLLTGLICTVQPARGESLFPQMHREEKAVSNLPQGDFRSLKELQLGEEEVMRVTMKQPSSYYLRGYIGETFTGAGWQRLNGDLLAGQNDLFYWLHEKNFYGYSQLGTAADLTGDEEVNHLEISFLNGAHKQLLFPYEVRNVQELILPLIGDSRYKAACSRGVQTYQMDVAMPQIAKRGALQQKLQTMSEEKKLQTYLRCENSYRQFVYEADTALDEETALILEKFLGAPEPIDTAQLKSKVLKLFEDFAYDENTSYSEEEGNFLKVFLEEQCGWSVHYATASALIFRYYGIPARYVEGYLLTPQDAAGAKEGEPIVLNSGNAHSWMEYYEDGIGWVPFETTGPYVGVMGSDDKVSYSSGKTQENQPKQQQKKPDEKKALTLEAEMMEHALFIFAGLLILLLLLLAGMIWFLHIRRSRKKGIRIKDDQQALLVMMRYLLHRMEKHGLPHKNLPMVSYSEEIQQRFDSALADDFSRAAQIYNGARYGGMMVSAEDRKFVTGLVKSIDKRTKKKRKKEKKDD